ncbi:hypothetical protein LOD99_7572 [Oopsacas minuta]|uniref:Uncharacterized protein n=1 Tax=Oopsacas minuta TaxID=111878 RepID=A0AAV7JPB9_9METZ|nr:hypothetical protein LOD99_7572 [Oopsacas minuta]
MSRYYWPKSKKAGISSGASKSANKRSKATTSEFILTFNTLLYEKMIAKFPQADIRLHIAVICKVPDIVYSHLFNKANPNLPLEGGITPLHCLFLNRMPTYEYYYPYISRFSLDKNTRTIINSLSSYGSRLLPDVNGITPLSLASWKHSKALGGYLLHSVNCTVIDILHNGYFSLPKNEHVGNFDLDSIKSDIYMHDARLKTALLQHVKHGITPHKIPIDITREFLTCVSDTNLTDYYEVYSSQLSSYLALASTPAQQLFPGVKYLFQKFVLTPISDSANFINYFPLFNTLMSWLNSHVSLSTLDVITCWEYIVLSFVNEEVREGLLLVAPGIVSYLRKFLIPLIDKTLQYPNYTLSLAVGKIILFLKLLSDCEQVEILLRHEMQEMFDLFNRKHLILSSLHSYATTDPSTKYKIIDRIELLDFAMSFAFNLNEYVYGANGTILHQAADIGDKELIRYYLKAGVSPMIKNMSGNTCLSILTVKNFTMYQEICQEFNLGKPYNLMLLCAYVYIRHRIPLKHLHKHNLLRDFVIKLCSPQICKQMCLHCYKDYYKYNY